jgi:hypothetical protein
MNFGLKTYLAEATKQYNVVLVKKKLFLNEHKDGNSHSWSITRANAIVTLWENDVMIGLKMDRGRLKWITVCDKEGRIRHSDAVASSLSEAIFTPTEYDELLKIGALKGLA